MRPAIDAVWFAARINKGVAGLWVVTSSKWYSLKLAIFSDLAAMWQQLLRVVIGIGN